MRPPLAALRVAPPPARHTYLYNASVDVRVPSLRDARHAGFRMSQEEMVTARKHETTTAIVAPSKETNYHVSRVGPTSSWVESHINKPDIERSHRKPVDPRISERERKANEVARGMTGFLSPAAPVAKILTRLTS